MARRDALTSEIENKTGQKLLKKSHQKASFSTFKPFHNKVTKTGQCSLAQIKRVIKYSSITVLIEVLYKLN